MNMTFRIRLGLCAAATVLLAFAASAVPTVDNVTLVQDTETQLVTISYDLSDGPAIVTFDLKADGNSIGANHLWNAEGDVNRLVTGDSTHTITWQPDGELGKLTLVAEVAAWDPSDPPDYMVVDLIRDNVINYYTSTNALPGGLFGNDAYRTTKMVFRFVRAKGIEWTMGVQEYTTTATKSHAVTLNANYWMAIFETTQAQWYALVGGDVLDNRANERYQGNGTGRFYAYHERDWKFRPVETTSFNRLRHNDYNSPANSDDTATYFYPHDPNPNSWLGRLRTKVGGGFKFDLPGEAQWEFACKSGEYRTYHWGNGQAFTSAAASWRLVPGRHYFNGGGSHGSVTSRGNIPDDPGWNPQTCTYERMSATARVGSYEPSLWGFYDMHGNVREFCLDWYADNILQLNGAINANGANYADGTAPAAAKRVVRGGYWYRNDWSYLLGGYREAGSTDDDDNSMINGFRVCCPVD